MQVPTLTNVKYFKTKRLLPVYLGSDCQEISFKSFKGLSIEPNSYFIVSNYLLFIITLLGSRLGMASGMPTDLKISKAGIDSSRVLKVQSKIMHRIRKLSEAKSRGQSSKQGLEIQGLFMNRFKEELKTVSGVRQSHG